MKKISVFLCVLLCMAMLGTSFPAYAKTSEFITFTVETIDSADNVISHKEVGYTDGKNLYVSIAFLERYTPYVFVKEANAFTRLGRDVKYRNGRVVIDFEKKLVTVNPIGFDAKEYKLDDIHIFGDEYFLPLDQMCAFLKATVTANNATIRILNSGYSLADAEYAWGTVAGDLAFSNFGYAEIVNDIFVGSDTLFYINAVKDYVSSTIFKLRLDNLLIVGGVGKLDDYKKFLENCVTTMEPYLLSCESTDDLMDVFVGFRGINDTGKKLTKKIKDLTTLVKNVNTPIVDGELHTELLDTDIKNLSAAVDLVSMTVESYDYLYKIGTMCDDNEKLLTEFEKYYKKAVIGEESSTEENVFLLATKTVEKQFNGDLAENVTAKILEMAVKKAGKESGKIVLKNLAPHTMVITSVGTFFELLGFDLTSNASYSVLVDFEARDTLNEYYKYCDESSRKVKTKEGSAEYRRAAILQQLALRQCFSSANTLGEKLMGGPGGIYYDEIELLDSITALYYAAAQSVKFDCFEGIEEVLAANKNVLKKSGLLKNAARITEEEFLESIKTSGGYWVTDQKVWSNLRQPYVSATKVNFDDTYMYYTQNVGTKTDVGGINHFVCDVIRKNLETGVTETILQSKIVSAFVVEGDYIYYSSLYDGKVFRCKTGTDNVETLAEKTYSPRFAINKEKIVICGMMNGVGSGLTIKNLDGSNPIVTGIYAENVYVYNNKAYTLGITGDDGKKKLVEIDLETGIHTEFEAELYEGYDLKYYNVLGADDIGIYLQSRGAVNKYVFADSSIKTLFKTHETPDVTVLGDDLAVYCFYSDLYLYKNGETTELGKCKGHFSFVNNDIYISDEGLKEWTFLCTLE